MKWLSLFFSKSRKTAARPRRRQRSPLHCEQLEDRSVPSATVAEPTFVLFNHVSNRYVPYAGSSTATGVTPAVMRAAYGVNQAMFGAVVGNGAGQTIAIIDAYNQPNLSSDLTAFDQAFGLAAPPSFKQINQTGGTTLPSNAPTGGWGVEESLDVEWAHVIAPAPASCSSRPIPPAIPTSTPPSTPPATTPASASFP